MQGFRFTPGTPGYPKSGSSDLGLEGMFWLWVLLIGGILVAAILIDWTMK